VASETAAFRALQQSRRHDCLSTGGALRKSWFSARCSCHADAM
jgi:hypothetical protein